MIIDAGLLLLFLSRNMLGDRGEGVRRELLSDDDDDEALENFLKLRMVGVAFLLDNEGNKFSFTIVLFSLPCKKLFVSYGEEKSGVDQGDCREGNAFLLDGVSEQRFRSPVLEAGESISFLII